MSLNFKIIGGKELSIYLGKVEKGIKTQIISGLREVGNHLQDKVKERFGHYHPSWPKLKRASVIAKYRRRTLNGISAKGRKISFSIGPDEPLILFGNLRDSINKDVNIGAKEVVVFSDNPYSAVHEYGYKNVPARSYMRTTLYDEQDEVVDIIGRKIGRII